MATASTDAVVFTYVIMRSTSVHAFKRGDGTAGEQPSKQMKIYLKLNKDVEVGIDLNEEEVISLGAGFAEIFTNEDLTSSLMDTINKVVSEANKKEEPEPEKDQEEDDDPDAERRDELIKDLRDLGYKVTEIDNESKIDVTTFDSDKAKYKFVKSWLKTGGIEFKESPSIGGKKIEYKLSSDDIVALEQYLIDNEVDKNILI